MTNAHLPELYLAIPAGALGAFGDGLAKTLRQAKIACLRVDGPFDDAGASALRRLVAQAHAAECAVVIADTPEAALRLARAVDADGVHLADEPEALARARKALDREAIVGIAAAQSRHAAMEAAEAGADYIAFAPDWPETGAPEIVAWWAAMIETPMVIENADTPERAKAVARLAEFVVIRADRPELIAAEATRMRGWLSQNALE